MLLLQFSTSPYCRKIRLALNYKKIPYQVCNLTPGAHILKLKPLTGLTTVPVLLPQQEGQPEVVADSTQIFHYLEKFCPEPSLLPDSPTAQRQMWLLEDWLDESIGIAVRFVYYQFRSTTGKSIDPSWFGQLVINIARRQFGITSASAKLAARRLEVAMDLLSIWQERPFLVENRLSYADLTAAALLSPLVVMSEYLDRYPWLFVRIREIHAICGESMPVLPLSP
jgi:glutathione S-transferase